MQEASGFASQPVAADVTERLVAKMVTAHLAALNIQLPRSRQKFAVHECRKCLSRDGPVSARRLIALALLLCPGVGQTKVNKMLMLIPPPHEVCQHTLLCGIVLTLGRRRCPVARFRTELECRA